MTINKIIMFHMAVTDMDKSKEFYEGKLGFKVTTDYEQNNGRWVSLELPGGGPSINLTTYHENLKPGTMKMYISTPDIEKVYKELQLKGITPTSKIIEQSWGTSFSFTDPDGNVWFMVQSKTIKNPKKNIFNHNILGIYS
jgi:predicted enzyme related to lactoylglutathione lyase